MGQPTSCLPAPRGGHISEPTGTTDHWTPSGCPQLSHSCSRTDLRAWSPRPHLDLLTDLGFGFWILHFGLGALFFLASLGLQPALAPQAPPVPLPAGCPSNPFWSQA